MAETAPTVLLDPSSFSYVVGIDIGSETCCFTVLTPQRQVVIKPTDLANASAGFALLQERIARLGVAPEQIVVGLEATSRYGENLFVRPDAACVERSASSQSSVQGCLQSLSASLVTVRWKARGNVQGSF